MINSTFPIVVLPPMARRDEPGKPESEPPTPLNEWFNPHDRNHLMALKTYMDSGRWPRFFIPADVAQGLAQADLIVRKVAAAYIEEKTGTATRARTVSPLPLPSYDEDRYNEPG